MAGIARRQRELEAGLAGCGRDALRRALERETGLRAGESFEPVAGNEQRLAVRFAVGFIRGGGAHATYSRIWAALRELSLLRVEGRVVEPGGGACPACAGAALQVYPTGLQELEGCRVTQADQEGRFVLHALARSADFRLGLSASVHGRRAAAVELTRAVVGVERVPFVAAFAGVRLELPAAAGGVAVVVATPGPAGPGSGRSPRPAAPGVDTAAPAGSPGSAGSGSPGRPAGPGVDTSVGRGSGPAAARPAPAPSPTAPPPRPLPDPGRPVPDLAGLSAEAASQRLAAAGLVPSLVGGDPAPRAELAYRVQSQDPRAGALARLGASVTVRVHAAFDARRTVPAVVGLAAAEAEQRLRAAGFVPELAGGDPAPTREAAFVVQSQEPAARAPLQAGARVRLRIHSAFHEPARAPLPPPPTAASPSAFVGGGHRGTFVCPALGATPPWSVEVAPGHSRVTCGRYYHGSRTLVASVHWQPEGDTGVWPLECGRGLTARFAPAGPVEGLSATVPGRMLGTASGSLRRAFLNLVWWTGADVPFPPELVDLAQRLLAEAEWRGQPCAGTSPPGAAARPPEEIRSPPARPATPQPPADGRLPCTCRDAAGKPYRMSLDQECDPASWLRTDDCRP